MKISDTLRQLADQLDSGDESGSINHVLQETGAAAPTFDSAGICSDDYWVRGHIGCMKGARLSDYSVCVTIMGQIGGDTPRHLYVLASPNFNPGGTGLNLMASAADADWINGRNYKPRNPPGQNLSDYNAAGRPSANTFGKFDNRGELVPAGEFSPA